MKPNFLQRKKSILSKKDKSFIGGWDSKIKKLCEEINFFENFYTTSSCSGRIVLLRDVEGERGNLFLKVWHDEINFLDLDEVLKKILGKFATPEFSPPPSPSTQPPALPKKIKYGVAGVAHLKIKFKQEPLILHVACADLESAQKILKIARELGLKRSGIISLEKNIVVEIIGNEKIEFPILENKKILVDEKFLKIVLKKANENLKKSWEEIEKLEKEIEKLRSEKI